MTFWHRLRNTWREMFGKPRLNSSDPLKGPDDFDCLHRPSPRQGWAFLEEPGDWGEVTRVQGRDER